MAKHAPQIINPRPPEAGSLFLKCRQSETSK
jgi:hypothetical protein